MGRGQKVRMPSSTSSPPPNTLFSFSRIYTSCHVYNQNIRFHLFQTTSLILAPQPGKWFPFDNSSWDERQRVCALYLKSIKHFTYMVGTWSYKKRYFHGWNHSFYKDGELSFLNSPKKGIFTKKDRDW